MWGGARGGEDWLGRQDPPPHALARQRSHAGLLAARRDAAHLRRDKANQVVQQKNAQRVGDYVEALQEPHAHAVQRQAHEQAQPARQRVRREPVQGAVVALPQLVARHGDDGGVVGRLLCVHFWVLRCRAGSRHGGARQAGAWHSLHKSATK